MSARGSVEAIAERYRVRWAIPARRRDRRSINLERFGMSTPASPAPYTEPWLRGTHAEVPAAGRAVLHALELAFDDITRWTEGLSDTEVHAQPLGLPAIGFHLRHIARSTDRILTYAGGGQLSPEQLATMKAEQSGKETLAELLAEVEASFANAEGRIRALASEDFNTPRGVG